MERSDSFWVERVVSPTSDAKFQLHYGYRSDSSGVEEKDSPSDDIPVIMLHGWLDSLHSFDQIAPLLKMRRMYALSMRGWGKSSRPANSTYSLDEYVADAMAFIKALNITKFHLVGHSMGSIIAYVIASRYPDQVVSLVLLSSSDRPPASIRGGTCCYFWCCCACCCCPPLRLYSETVLRSLQGVDQMVRNKYITQERADQLMDETRLGAPEAIKKSLNMLCAWNGIKDLAQVTCPTLVVWGTDDDLFPRNNQIVILKAIKGSEFQPIDKGMHGVLWTHPDQVAKCVNEFYSKLANTKPSKTS